MANDKRLGRMRAAVVAGDHVFARLIIRGSGRRTGLGELFFNQPDQKPDHQKQDEQTKNHINRINNYWLWTFQPVVYITSPV